VSSLSWYHELLMSSLLVRAELFVCGVTAAFSLK